MRNIRFLFTRLLPAGILIFLTAALALSALGAKENAFPADAAVVLGNKANPDGTPSPRLAARLDRALRLYREGLCPTIIVSGGTGKEGVDEAAVMAAYLQSHGVPKSAIVQDPDGVNTAATAAFAASWLRANNKTSVIAVSQYFHLPRTRLALKRAGLSRIGTARAAYVEARDVFSISREVAAYAAYFLGLRDK